MPLQSPEVVILAATVPVEHYLTTVGLGVVGGGLVLRWLRQDNRELRRDLDQRRASDQRIALAMQTVTEAINEHIRNTSRLADIQISTAAEHRRTLEQLAASHAASLERLANEVSRLAGGVNRAS